MTTLPGPPDGSSEKYPERYRALVAEARSASAERMERNRAQWEAGLCKAPHPKRDTYERAHGPSVGDYYDGKSSAKRKRQSARRVRLKAATATPEAADHYLRETEPGMWRAVQEAITAKGAQRVVSRMSGKLAARAVEAARGPRNDEGKRPRDWTHPVAQKCAQNAGLLWAASRACSRNGYGRVTEGFAEELFAALMRNPQHDGRPYSRSALTNSANGSLFLLAQAGFMEVLQPMEGPDGKAPQHFPPHLVGDKSGCAFNQYWFRAELVRSWFYEANLVVDGEHLSDELQHELRPDLYGPAPSAGPDPPA